MATFYNRQLSNILSGILKYPFDQTNKCQMSIKTTIKKKKKTTIKLNTRGKKYRQNCTIL